MSAPPIPLVPAPSNFKDIGGQLESFQHVDSSRQQLLEGLVKRVSELEAALQVATSDLEDEKSIRRQWKSRAEDAEASLSRNQFVLALIDGNRYTFGDAYLKNTEMGGADAAKDLVDQIRNHIRKRSLHEDPNKVALMVHIFANKTALSQALVDSGTISEPRCLDDFIAEFMNSQQFLYFMDCGSSEGAVDAKIQESYEFHFENAHCKHLLLALRHESGYITELDTYREDESTLARTSLMRSSHAVVGKFASAFHVADTPALRTIALISLEHTNGNSSGENGESRPSVVKNRISTRNHDLQGLFEVEGQKTAVAEGDAINQRHSTDPTAHESDSSTTSKNAAVTWDGEPAEPIQSPQLIQETKNSMNVTVPHVTPLHQSNTGPYLGSVHSYMNDWDSAPPVDIYTPPPDLRPWGSEDVLSRDDAANMKGSGSLTEKAAIRTSSREPIRKSFDMPKKGSSGKLDHQHHGNGAASDRKGKQNPKQSLPLSRDPRYVPELIPTRGRIASSGLLESKHSLPSSKQSGPQFPNGAAVAINRHGQRIDMPLPRPSVDDQKRYASRWHARKLCNDHHLRGECSNQDCKFDHEPIDEGVRIALRLSARNILCRNGPGCRRQNCPHGHHCPYQLSPTGCTNQKCAFKAKGMHNVDDLTIESIVNG